MTLLEMRPNQTTGGSDVATADEDVAASAVPESHEYVLIQRGSLPADEGYQTEDEALHEILKATADRYEGTNWRDTFEPI